MAQLARAAYAAPTARLGVLGPPDPITHASVLGPPDPATDAGLYGPPDPGTGAGDDKGPSDAT
jgi:hypothetical protein